MSQGKTFALDQLMSQLGEEEYFLDFLKVRNLDAGIIVLRPDQEDTQEPHSEDELYYVIDGSGWIKLGKEKVKVKKGSIIFVPAGLHHKFYGNKENLVILYVFAA